MPPDSEGLTFLTWVDNDPIVYVTLMQPNLIRQLRIMVNGLDSHGLSYKVELLELTPEESKATLKVMSDRSLVYLLMELNVVPSDREKILDRLNVL